MKLHYQKITAAEEKLNQVNQGLGFSVADTSPSVPAVMKVDRELLSSVVKIPIKTILT